MMRKEAVGNSPSYAIDLTKIEGEGSFPCPRCGSVISPEDETEEIYKIVDTKIVNDQLVELVVMCRSCGSNIRLSGFQSNVPGLINE